MRPESTCCCWFVRHFRWPCVCVHRRLGGVFRKNLYAALTHTHAHAQKHSDKPVRIVRVLCALGGAVLGSERISREYVARARVRPALAICMRQRLLRAICRLLRVAGHAASCIIAHYSFRMGTRCRHGPRGLPGYVECVRFRRRQLKPFPLCDSEIR